MKARFKKGQEIYQICPQSKSISTVIVKSCGLKKLNLVSDAHHGATTPNTTYDGYLVYHSTVQEAQKELDK